MGSVLSPWSASHVASASCGILLAACSAGSVVVSGAPGDGSSGSSGADGTSGGNDGTSSGASSGTSGASSGSTGSSGDAPKETKVGTITVMSTAYRVGTTPVEMGSAFGTFYRLPAPIGTTASACTTTTTGACTVNTCTFGSSSPDAGTPSIDYTNAGVATVSGVLVNDGSMTLTPGGYGYQTVSGSVAFFKGGETVRISAPGNPSGAPAFSISLKAPASMTVTAPVFDAQSKIVVASGQSLSVGWQSATAGEVVVQIASGTSAKSATARCAFPSSAGSGAVPASVLSSVYGIGAQTSVTISAESRDVQKPDGWEITISLQSYGIRSGTNGGIASGILQLN